MVNPSARARFSLENLTDEHVGIDISEIARREFAFCDDVLSLCTRKEEDLDIDLIAHSSCRKPL